MMRNLLALGMMAAALLPNPSSARPSSSKWQDDVEKNVHSYDNSEEVPDILTVKSDFFENTLFDEDYLYSFVQPTTNTQHWEIHRIPKTLQSDEFSHRKLRHRCHHHHNHVNSSNTTNTTNNESNTDENEEEEDLFIIANTLLSLSCVILAALAAGLTMGMLSIEPLSLEIKRRASFCPREKEWSEQLLPLLVGHSKRHRLLVSLLLLNSLANEALPLFLDELMPARWMSILVSVTLVLFFGEIVPSAFFTGPNQVELAAKLIPVVRVVMFVLAPIAVPIAKLLDRVLHNDDSRGSHNGSSNSVDHVEADVTEGNYYNRKEVSSIIIMLWRD